MAHIIRHFMQICTAAPKEWPRKVTANKNNIHDKEIREKKHNYILMGT